MIERQGGPRIGEAQRRRGIIALLVSNGLMFGGFFMLVPLISVHYTERLGFAAASVGLALALRQLTQQGLTLFGGAISDRLGPRRLIVAGAIIRTFGFVGLAWATTLPLLLLMCFVAALGGALFDAPSNAAITALTHPRERPRMFALSGVASSLGMTVGPLLGGLFVRYDFMLVCFASAACFGLVGMLAAFALPEIRPTRDSQPTFISSMGQIWHNRSFVTLTVLLGGYWFLWVQLTISLPLAAERLAGQSPGSGLAGSVVAWMLFYSSPVTLMYLLNSLLTIFLQFILVQLAGRFLTPLATLAFGVACASVGLASVAFADSLLGLLGAVAIFSLGTLLVAPTSRTLTSELAQPHLIGAYFGASSLAVAFGGGLGNFAGGWLSDLGTRLALPTLPWLVFGCVGAATSLGLAVLGRVLSRRERRTTQLQQKNP